MRKGRRTPPSARGALPPPTAPPTTADEPLQNLLVRIPASKHRAFKARAATDGETMQDVLERCVDAYLLAPR